MSVTKRASFRIKRSPYVSKNMGNAAADYKASNGDAHEEPSRKEVRKELSVWKLKKDSECFTRDEDHIYSKGKCEEDINIAKKFKCDGLPRVYVTRSTAFMRSQSKDHETVGHDDEEKDNSSFLPVKHQRCLTRNAINARLNREKKKQYISSLESIKDNLTKENREMRQKVNNQEKVIAALQYEVKYLKSMLANSKEISEILKSLTESTGLPVSSSLQSAAFRESDIASNNINAFQANEGGHIKTHSQIRQPLFKKVTSGTNFPILQKDVNLGYFDSHDENELLNQGCEDMDPSLSPVSDLSWDSVFLNECNFDLNVSSFDHPISAFSSETENINQKNELSVNTEFQDNDVNESDVGLCLHVNKKKISVELCSLCNTRAQMK